MKGWKGVLLALVAVAAILAVLAPSWLEDWNQQRAEEARQFRQQGQQFGQQADTQQCMDKALDGLKGCQGNTCTINQGIFLKACLEVAQPNPVLCEGIPPFRNQMLEEEKEWARFFCRDKAISHEGCRFLLRRQQSFCADGVAVDAVSNEQTGGE
ncbi:MAG: hypothetical protein OIF57_17110 [Marinobacterium sp.]|nr:hypothetical protein [Marinobacterium sp.]